MSSSPFISQGIKAENSKVVSARSLSISHITFFSHYFVKTPGKSNIRKPAGTLNIKRSGKAAAYKPGRKPLYHAKKKAVRGKVLVNRRRIIAAKKRKSSNNN